MPTIEAADTAGAPKTDARRRRLRRWLAGIGVLTLLLLLWAGALLWLASDARQHFAALQTLLQQRPLTSATANAACAEAMAGGVALRRLRGGLLPAAPLLRRLGFMPRIGPALAATPDLSDLGAAGADLLDAACASAAPAFAALDDHPEGARAGRLREAMGLLAAAPPDWPRLRNAMARADAAWRAIPQAAFASGPLAAYREPAERFGTLLPAVATSLGLLERLWPAAPALLGLDQPLTLLVAGQNPFELRPTGGFIGSVATLMIDGGNARLLEFRNSGDLNAAAPPGSAMPAPYAAYLRGSQWFLRDSNWWPDWRRSARTLQTFWELNGGAPVDGVVGVDLYALQELVAALGSLEVPGYGLISDTGSLEAIYRFYEPQGAASATNKSFLGALFKAALGQAQGASPSQWPLIGAALERSLAARHISVYLHDPTSQAAFAAQGWDGALRSPDDDRPGDSLLVVDADLSYSDVQSFIDQRISLDIELGPPGASITHTLTITYANRYDDWRAEETHHQVYGYCYNVARGLQERIPGCYGDYVRVYLPPTAAPLDLRGADTPIEPGSEDGRSLAGMYLVVAPGQTRAVTLRYLTRPVAGQPYRLLVEKQAGTLARPFVLQVRAAAGAIQAQADLWHDLRIEVADGPDGPALLAPLPALHPSNTPERLAALPAWSAGWRRWSAGDHAGAVEHWAATGTLPAALDQVAALRWGGDLRQAQELLDALKNRLPADGRAAYWSGQLAELRGDLASAVAAYGRAIELAPRSQIARLALALAQAGQGDQTAALATLRGMADPIQALRRVEFDQRAAGDFAAADATNRLILRLSPADREAWYQRYWMLRVGAGERVDWAAIIDLAGAALAAIPGDAEWLGRRGEAYQQLDQREAALADLQQVTAISPTDSLAWYRTGLLRRAQNDLAAAQTAFEAAVRFDDGRHLEYVMALATTYEALGLADQARAAYERARALAPDDPAIREALARLGG